MKAILAIGEYLFAILLGLIMFVWLILCMFAELPGLRRYIRLSNM